MCPSQFLLATSSVGKAIELRAMLKNQGIDAEIKTYADFGLIAPDETGTTFHDNAMIKCMAGFKATNLPTLADDSGLCVPAINNQPGVYSADWAEDTVGNRDFTRAMQRIDSELGDKDRSAYFTCTLLFHDGITIHEAEGRVTGRLLKANEAMGDNGHGYDPWFVPDGYDQSFGVLSSDIKNSLSHRGRAFEKLLKL